MVAPVTALPEPSFTIPLTSLNGNGGGSAVLRTGLVCCASKFPEIKMSKLVIIILVM